MKNFYTTVALGALLLQLVLPLQAQARTIKTQPLDCYHRSSAGMASCYGRVQTDGVALPLVSGAPSGYGPNQFHAAYAMPAKATHPAPIALVAAYHDTALAHDLQTYDATFGLPDPPALTQLSQRGDHNYPAANAGWALELSMDVEMAHQMCQNCPIIVVEADSAAMTNLMAAVATAVRAGAAVVSNSYGGQELASQTRSDATFNRPGVTMVASAGDSGYGVSYPAASPYVVAAGGTSLTLRASGLRLHETAWTDGGSGCSSYEAKPAWQHDKSCANRTVTDLAADADPATGAAVYDSTVYEGKRGWFVLGGTSLSAPLLAGMMALSGGTNSAAIYAHPSGLYDVTSGSNGSCGSYLCKARSGYDGPTGLGSPNGLASLGGQ
jgi:subtilase family serine protease